MVGEAAATTVLLNKVLQLRPRRGGAYSGVAKKPVRSSCTEVALRLLFLVATTMLWARQMSWFKVCGMWTADPMLSSDEVGRKLRVWSLSGMGMIPGRRATMEKASPVAEGKFIGSQSIFAMVLLWFMDCWSPSLSSSWCSGSGEDERWVKKAACEQPLKTFLSFVIW
jgi:hypothetical protein